MARNRCRRRQVYRSTNVLAIVGARPPMQQGSVRSNWISPGLWGWHGLGLEQASKERSTSSWPARWPWIILQIYPHHQSALRMIPCALEFRNRSCRLAWICKQMHPQLMTIFYNLLFKFKKRKLNPWCKLYFINHSYSAFVWDRGLASDSEIWYNSSLFCKALFDFRGMRMVPIVKGTRDYRCSHF